MALACAIAQLACSSGSGSSGNAGAGSGADSGSSSGGGGGTDASADRGSMPSCNDVASSVAASELPTYMPVAQVIGACSSTDIADYVLACDSASATNADCENWFASAPATCQSCLVGPVVGGDPGTPTGRGAIWLDAAGDNIGANVPGCLDEEGMNACATAYQALVECFYAAGCAACADQSSYDGCQKTVTAKGGACNTYLTSAQSACSASTADGGLLASGGACATDQQVISVICGNGSGDGG